MALDPVLADLLTRWARWCLAGNRAGLGYAQSGYVERIGLSWSVDSTPAPVDPDILRVDHCVRSLPPEHRAVIVTHYLQPGAVQQKLGRVGMTRAAYYAALDHGRTFLRHALQDKSDDY